MINNATYSGVLKNLRYHILILIVSSVLAGIDAEYGNIVKMTITRGKIHKYLRMTICYSSPGKVIFSMVNYIENILNDILEDMKEGSETPESYHLFDIVEDANKLSWTNA